jgi:putative resolvase
LKLSEWARRNGIPYKTAWTWFRQGILPDPAIQLKTGTILVRVNEVPPDGIVALYARVSSHGQKADLERQQGRLVAWATAQGLHVGRVVAEIGSGLNGHRSKLLTLLRDPDVATIVVEHRDRLARFGSDYIEAAMRTSGRRLLVVEPGEANDDLVQDMVDVLTSFCGRLYGKRSAQTRAHRALRAAAEAT